MTFDWAIDLRDAILHARDQRRQRAANLDQIAKLERAAVRITSGPFGRCYQMADGQLLAIRNAQRPGERVVRIQWVTAIRPADAEDGYGWTP